MRTTCRCVACDVAVDSPLSPLIAHARKWPAGRVDGALALLLLVLTAIELAGGRGISAGGAAVTFVPVAVVAAAVALRRRFTFEAAIAGTLGLAALWLPDPDTRDVLTAVYFAWGLLTFTAGARLERERLVWVIALGLGELVLISAVEGGVTVVQMLTGMLLFVAAPVGAGRLLRARSGLARELAQQAALLEAERTDRIEEAVSGERVRIAGELHDVVAHALGAMTIQAAVARRMADTDAERAGAAFQAVETTGREALTELRTLMEVLRHGPDQEAALEPQPGLAGLAALAERSGDLGLPVGIDVTGTAPADLPRGVDLTGYRVVQEALTEALARGGAGRAHVTVAYREDEVVLTVLDDGVRVAGRRLVGLRERVRVCGGTIEAGARPSGGHLVDVRLPLSGVAA
jgi:signal transduction histidine kinase